MRRLVLIALLATACIEETPGARDWCELGGRGVLVLVDRTTPLTAREESQVRESIGSIRAAIGPGDRVQLRTIENLFANSITRDIGCRPGCPPNTGFTSEGANCSRGIAMQADGAFQKRLNSAIEDVLAPENEQRNSDVAATIAGAVRGFTAHRALTDLYLFSDLVENSQHLPRDHLFNLSIEEALSVAREHDALPAMNGTTVHIVGFGRNHDSNREPIDAAHLAHLRAFWNEYFLAATGKPPSYESTVTR